jgi:hypothetical protein
MKTPEQIINEIRNFISLSRPFRFTHSEENILNSLTELENTLFPSEEVIEEEPVIEVVEETVIEVVEETVVEVIEETVVEEPTIEEPVVAKRGAKKK